MYILKLTDDSSVIEIPRPKTDQSSVRRWGILKRREMRCRSSARCAGTRHRISRLFGPHVGPLGRATSFKLDIDLSVSSFFVELDRLFLDQSS